MNAYGSSVPRVSAPLWRITVLPGTANQIWWMILGVGRTYVSSRCWHFSQRSALFLLRRLSQYRPAFSVSGWMSSNQRKFPRIP
jgi:hypothetical protein